MHTLMICDMYSSWQELVLYNMLQVTDLLAMPVGATDKQFWCTGWAYSRFFMEICLTMPNDGAVSSDTVKIIAFPGFNRYVDIVIQFTL